MSPDNQQQDSTIHFSHSPFNGHEDDILALLHRNRPEEFTKEYLNWRYLGEPSDISPVVFWVENGNNKKVGMCSLIFRKYWIKGSPASIAVAGDTSLDNDYRGKGIAKKLFNYINTYLEEHGHPYALAIANESFARSAASAGWIEAEKIVAWVLILDWSIFLARLIPLPILPAIPGTLLNLCTDKLFRKPVHSSFTFRISDFIDQTIDTVWNAYDKNSVFIKDRSYPTLHWRYETIHKHYRFFHLFHEKTLCGMIVFSITKSVCYIADCIIPDTNNISPGFNMFSQYLFSCKTIGTVRITMNEKHPYTPLLQNLGFVPRTYDALLMIAEQMPSNKKIFLKKFIMSGDKDI